MAVLENKEMPRTLLGIQGLSLFNILLANIILGWLTMRTRLGWNWDVPRELTRAYLLFGAVIVVSFVRLAMDFGHFTVESTMGPSNMSFGSALSEYLINSFKWTVPGILLLDGCRTERMQKQALFVIVGLYVLLGVLIIRYMSSHLGALVSGGLDHDSARILHKRVGYFRVSLSMMLAGGSWAVLALFPLVRTRIRQFLLLVVSGIVLVGQALTGGRTGYVVWGVIGGVFGVLKYRKFLWLIPAVGIGVVVFLPGVTNRLLTGLGGSPDGDEAEVSKEVFTAGRSLVWPVVIKEISQSPLIGYGRRAYDRRNLQEIVMDQSGDDAFGHPHCAYLEFLLDNGILGLLAVVPLFMLVVRSALFLFLANDNPVHAAAGGVCVALVCSFLIASLTAQTLYPVENVAGMWASIGLALRVAIDRRRGAVNTEATEVDFESELKESAT